MALDAAALLTNTYCLHEISKNVEGEVLVMQVDQKTCLNPGCEFLVLVQQLKLTLRSADCDSKLGTVLDGVMRVGNLTTVFTGRREHLRGVHAATSTGSRSRAEVSAAARCRGSPTPASSGPRCPRAANYAATPIS